MLYILTGKRREGYYLLSQYTDRKV